MYYAVSARYVYNIVWWVKINKCLFWAFSFDKENYFYLVHFTYSFISLLLHKQFTRMEGQWFCTRWRPWGATEVFRHHLKLE